MSEATGAARRRPALWLTILTAFGLTVGAALLWLHYQQEADFRDLQAALAETDALEPDGWRLEDLERQRRHIPDEENSALVILHAVRLDPGNWPCWWNPRPTGPLYDSFDDTSEEELMIDLEEVPPNYLLDDIRFNILRNEVCRNYRQLAALAALDGKISGRFPHTTASPVIFTSYGRVQELRTVMRALGFQARVHAQEGNFGAAWQSLTRMLLAARSIGDDCATVPLLVRMAGTSILAQNTEIVLAMGPTEDNHLQLLQNLVKLESQESLFYRLLRGERAFVDRCHEELSAGIISYSNLAGASGLSEGSFGGLLGEYYLRFSYGSIMSRRAQYLRHFNRIQSQLAESPDNTITLLIQEEGMHKVSHPLVREQIELTYRLAKAYASYAAKLRCLLVVLALERYRLRHGAWPKSLDDLVPEFLEAVPLDPFDGQPLRYATPPEGRVVYSVGMDRSDNGGVIAATSRKNTDMGLRLYDPEHRRKPPRDRELIAEP